jgi:hypothetical protein
MDCGTLERRKRRQVVRIFPGNPGTFMNNSKTYVYKKVNIF